MLNPTISPRPKAPKARKAQLEPRKFSKFKV